MGVKGGIYPDLAKKDITPNEAPRSKLRGIKAKLGRSQPIFALEGFDAVRPAIHPCSTRGASACAARAAGYFGEGE